MEKLTKEEIEGIGKRMFLESDVIANHGTSIKNGMSILETGFNFNRTSMVVEKDNDVLKLCTYGWKENEIGDSSNVIISVPKSFFKQLLGFDDKEYSEWINNCKKDGNEELLINSVCDMEINGPIIKATLPREFIRGMFVYTDNVNFYSFLDDREKAMEHLAYVDNPNFFENLDKETQKAFVDEMRKKMFPDNNKSK